MTKYFRLGIGLKWSFRTTNKVGIAKAGLVLPQQNYTDIGQQVYFQDYIQPVNCVIAETDLAPTQALVGTVTSGGAITTVISETLSAPSQALAGNVSVPVFSSVIAETLVAPTEALTGTVSAPSGISFVVGETLAPPTQALVGTTSDPVTGITFIVDQTMPPPSQCIEIYDGYYDRIPTGAGGNYHDKDANAPKFVDPGKSVKYDPSKRVIQKRVVAQSAPPPSQNITVEYRLGGETMVVSVAPPPVVKIEAKAKNQGFRAVDEEELLMLLLEAA